MLTLAMGCFTQLVQHSPIRTASLQCNQAIEFAHTLGLRHL